MLFRWVLVFLSLFSLSSALDEKLKFGLLYNKIFSNEQEAQIATKLWIKQSYLDEYTKNLEIVFYDDSEKLLKEFISGKVKVILVNPTFYFKNKNILEKIKADKWNMSRTQDKFEQLYLITNKQTKHQFYEKEIKTIYYKLDLSRVWLSSLLDEKSKKKFNFDQKSMKVEKSKKLVFNQFFSKDSYSIVSKDLYESMINLNPQIASKIKIVKKSKPIFFRGLGFTRKDLDKKFHDMVFKTIYKVNATKTEFNRFSYFDAQTIYILNDDDLLELDKMHQKYFAIKGK